MSQHPRTGGSPVPELSKRLQRWVYALLAVEMTLVVFAYLRWTIHSPAASRFVTPYSAAPADTDFASVYRAAQGMVRRAAGTPELPITPQTLTFPDGRDVTIQKYTDHGYVPYFFVRGQNAEGVPLHRRCQVNLYLQGTGWVAKELSFRSMDGASYLLEGQEDVAR